MKKIISFILAFVMLLSSGMDMYIVKAQDTIESERIEDTYVDFSCFTEKEITAVEMYTAQNELGEYYITNVEELKAQLSKDKYDMVEQQINITNMNNGIALLSDEDGSSKNPYELTDGTRKSVTSESVWFKCKIWGAVDFNISSGKSGSTITVYKKTLLGKKELYTVNGRTLSKTLSDCSINNNGNTYIINVNAPSSTTIRCTVKTHIDKKSNSKGALWIPEETTAMYDTDILYMKYWYVDKKRVKNIREMVTHADFLDAQSNVANGTIGLSMFLTSLGLKNTSTLLSIAGVITAFRAPFDFKEDTLDQIDEAAGYIGEINGEYVYSNGCLIIEYMYNGITFYEVEPWTGSSMTGPEGWTGTWTVNK